MSTRSLSSLLIPLIVIQFSVVGCNKPVGPKRYHVSGKVTFQGRPVPFGDIMFVPDRSRGNDGPGGFAKIKDGKFDTAIDGKGTVGGAQEVVITGSSVSLERNTDEPIYPLLPEYHIQVELPQATTTFDFEVPATANVSK